MGKWCVIALAGLGCNAIFEENPAFTPDTDSGTSVVSDSFESGTSASASGSTGSPSSSDSGDDVPAECVGVDMYEPNDAASQLAVLEGVTSQEAVPVSAQLDGAADEDWFKLAVEQAGATLPQPTASVAAPEPVLLCHHVTCMDGETVVDCGAFVPHTEGNNEGCCGEDEVSFGYDCVGAVDLDASTYIRVTAAAPTEACIPYDLTLHFAG